MAFAMKPKTKARAAAIAPPMPGPAPDDESGLGEDEGSEDESGEECRAAITAEQLQELEEQGTVELQSDDGEKIVLTMDQGEGAEESGE